LAILYTERNKFYSILLLLPPIRYGETFARCILIYMNMIVQSVSNQP